MTLKTGPFSLEEKAFIDQNVHRLDIFDLAQALNKNVESVKNYVKSKTRASDKRLHDSDDQHLIIKLNNRYYWNEIAHQFNDEELKFFEYKWIEYYKQFAEDVTATEENEMIELIRVSQGRVIANHSCILPWICSYLEDGCIHPFSDQRQGLHGSWLIFVSIHSNIQPTGWMHKIKTNIPSWSCDGIFNDQGLHCNSKTASCMQPVCIVRRL